ncbi:anti-sigma factor family protein, partial [Pyxidicoccus sp. 3LFB2]
MSPHCNRLYLFLDGELGAVDEENFRHHLARCEPCASGLHEAMQLELLSLQALGGRPVPLKAVEAPEAFAPERQTRVRLPRGRWPVALALAA